MNKKNIFKSIALVNFVVLLTMFLLYSNGSFHNYVFSERASKLASPNGGTPTKISNDTTTKKKDSLPRLRMGSSKSIVIADLKPIKDTTKRKEDSTISKITDEERKLMYSSKSGMIIDHGSFSADSVKLKKNKQKKKGRL